MDEPQPDPNAPQPGDKCAQCHQNRYEHGDGRSIKHEFKEDGSRAPAPAEPVEEETTESTPETQVVGREPATENPVPEEVPLLFRFQWDEEERLYSLRAGIHLEETHVEVTIHVPTTSDAIVGVGWEPLTYGYIGRPATALMELVIVYLTVDDHIAGKVRDKLSEMVDAYRKTETGEERKQLRSEFDERFGKKEESS